MVAVGNTREKSGFSEANPIYVSHIFRLLNYHINFHQIYENHKEKIYIYTVYIKREGPSRRVYLGIIAEMVPYHRELCYG